MSFWNDPANGSIKAVLGLVLLAVVGFGIYKLVGDPSNSQQGSVYQATKKTNSGNLGISFEYKKDGTCVMNTCASATVGGSTLSCVAYTGVTHTYESGKKVCDTSASVAAKQFTASTFSSTGMAQ